MTHFIQKLQRFSPLNEEAVRDLILEIGHKTFDKGELILDSGKICGQLYFLEEGLVKLFFCKEDKEFIMRFFSEGSIFTGLDSYLTESYSDYSIQTLERSVVSRISHSKMEELCKKHHCIETAFRKFVSMAAINMMNRISEMLEENAANRYTAFVQANPDILQRISLGDLAGYLGITQVSLSRIRAKK